MLTLEECRKIDPKLNHLTDEELLDARDRLYVLARLALDDWYKKKQKGSEK